MARDISLMSQSEVAEVAEPPILGRGGSSSMPQKCNPVGCAIVLANAIRVPALVSVMLSAMPQEHERALGGWPAEWETLPEIFLLTSGALSQMKQIISGLRIDPQKMLANLEATQGLIYAEPLSTALAKSIGKAAAHEIVERACRKAIEQNRHLRELVLCDSEINAHLSVDVLKMLFDPQPHVHAAAKMVDQALVTVQHAVSALSKESEACPLRS
jgi:3-carboxy-cis,cis-muconate cycloisomerase